MECFLIEAPEDLVGDLRLVGQRDADLGLDAAHRASRQSDEDTLDAAGRHRRLALQLVDDACDPQRCLLQILNHTVAYHLDMLLLLYGDDVELAGG